MLLAWCVSPVTKQIRTNVCLLTRASLALTWQKCLICLCFFNFFSQGKVVLDHTKWLTVTKICPTPCVFCKNVIHTHIVADSNHHCVQYVCGRHKSKKPQRLFALSANYHSCLTPASFLVFFSFFPFLSLVFFLFCQRLKSVTYFPRQIISGCRNDQKWGKFPLGIEERRLGTKQVVNLTWH